ncbi:hypothetical protein NT6N_20940 [Oceaniferula spumae]|uniref:Transcriptional regulator LacI/GalR-like sensor domain-containing protein n=1 Tax=Oceaniferula spumae TaxID=2979115 RepID=A0AAT9FMA8_9BACT
MGESIERKSLVVQLAERIEHAIRVQTWDGKLPGKRPLADRFGVNVKTCARALDLLEQRGLLEPAVTGKRRVICKSALGGKNVEARRGQRLLFLHQAHVPLSYCDVMMMREMQEIWEREGGQAMWARVDYGRARKPGLALKKLIERHAADALVLHMPGSGWGREAALRLPCYQLGGDFPSDVSVSLTAYALDKEIARVVELLSKLGHHRILLPLEGSMASVRKAVLGGLRMGVAEQPKEGKWEDYCPEFTESVPEVWNDYWKKSFASLRPTAVVVFEDTHLLSLYGYCAVNGIRIPQDLSVISFAFDQRFEWVRPKPVMMRFPVQQCIANFKDWMARGMQPIGRKYLKLELLDGDSVARLG